MDGEVRGAGWTNLLEGRLLEHCEVGVARGCLHGLLPSLEDLLFHLAHLVNQSLRLNERGH